MVTNNKTLKKLHNIQTQCPSLVPRLEMSYNSHLLSDFGTFALATLAALTRKYVVLHARVDDPHATIHHAHAHARSRTYPIADILVGRSGLPSSRYGIIRFYVRNQLIYLATEHLKFSYLHFSRTSSHGCSTPLRLKVKCSAFLQVSPPRIVLMGARCNATIVVAGLRSFDCSGCARGDLDYIVMSGHPLGSMTSGEERLSRDGCFERS